MTQAVNPFPNGGMAEQNGERSGLEVAVVGMAGRFPGAGDIHAFWRNLREGVESIARFTREELLEAGQDPAVLDHPGFVPAKGELRGADEFDATLFGLTPRDAEVLNPQHRVLLECAWTALEHAGYDPARVGRPVGVFAGGGTNGYVLNLLSSPELARTVGMLRISLGNDKDHLAAGVSYRLDLRGPSVAVQTACSTSLVAVHLACQSLINGECDMALAGGVAVSVPLRNGYVHTPDGILSPDGHCRAFDAEARGSIGGSGAGLVVLKRLDDALDDGDTIHAVIRGSAINNDGAQKVGYTAPSITGQARVLSEAMQIAGVDPATLQYVETHGTGTPLGDAIELKAMSQALARGKGAKQVAIGSVKTNVGHLDTAAGIAGLIKTVLAIRHREIPPSLHCATPHPEIAASGGRVFVNTQLRPWARNGTPRRAGVSSFGLGGTNAHLVLEEAPEREPAAPSRARQLLVLSARTATALKTSAENLAAHLETEETALADAAFTLQTGRRELEHRLAVVCADAAEGARALRQAAGRDSSAVPRTDRPVAFMFPGLGMQYVEMGRGLYDAEPAYRAAVDECCELLRPVLGSDLRELLFPASADGKAGGGWDLRAMLGRGGATSPLDDTRVAQPAVFVTAYALAKLWMSWGVRPRALVGHSLGEYVAACVSGVLRLEDALKLVALRARLIDTLPAGAMLAVPLAEAALREILPPALDLAAVNTTESCVVSGAEAEVEAFEAVLTERGVVSRRLAARHAFHSRAMAPVAAELERLVAGFELRAPEIPFVSNATGTWISDQEARSPGYWARHLCETVRFADGIATLRQEPGWVLLEVGPGQALGAWAMQHPQAGEAQVVASSLRHPHNRVDDLAFLLETLGRLWTAGVSVNWTAFSADERRQRVPLPGYPFERRRFWVEPPRRAAASAVPSSADPAPVPTAAAAAEPIVAPQPVQTVPTETPAAPEAAAAAPPSRIQTILGKLAEIAAELTGIAAEQVQTDVHFFQAGIDSLLLLQAIQSVEKRMGVRLSLIEMLEEMTTLDAVAHYIDTVLPPEAFVTPEPAAPAPAPEEPAAAASPASSDDAAQPARAVVPAPPAFYPAPAGAAAGAGDSAVERVIAQQLQLMAQQLAVLRGDPSAAASASPVVAEAASAPAPAAAAPASAPAATATPAAPRVIAQSAQAKIRPETPYVAYQPVNTEAPGGMTPVQKEWLDDFIARYVAKTKASKAHQARYHLPLADSRVTARFRRAWKEISYPIVSDHARGSRVWDADGNEYVDIGMAFGCSLFGHGPEFVSKAIQEQVERGYGLGPQSPLAGKAAELVCELGGIDRVVFCNSGTEAVTGAIRAARTYTGRNKVAYFSGAYHGWNDVVQGRLFNVGGKREARPTAPGIAALPLQDVVLLDWDEPSTFKLLEEHKDEIALVLVEPVQSRRPDMQPRDFLHELRRVTKEYGMLLLFDELITGFRILPGGAQSFFDVQADLVTYGKIVAGGLPMGVVGGKKDVMAVFDGGLWNFGDDSFPPAQRTLFAGAFFKHPISMGVTCAIMEEIRRQGEPMYAELNRRASGLVQRMNDFFEAGRYPIQAVNFGSVFRFFIGGEVKFPDLFNYHLNLEGVLTIPETGTGFISTAHSDEDLEIILRGVQASAEGMRRGGFIPPPPGGGGEALTPAVSANGASANGAGERREGGVRAVPLTEGQRQLWIESQMGEEAALAYVESNSLLLHGRLDADALARAVQGLVDRHDALRTTFSPDGDVQLIHPTATAVLARADFTNLDASAREAAVEGWLQREVKRPFDLAEGPVARFAVAALEPERHLLVISAHHAVLDGWSFGILLGDLGALYLAAKEGRTAALPPARSYGDQARETAAAGQPERSKSAEEFWLREYADGVPVLDLPADRPRPLVRSYRGARLERSMDGALMGRLAPFCKANGFTLFNVMLSAFSAWLGRIAGQDDVVVGVPSAGQAAMGEAGAVVGYNINVLPLRTRPEPGIPFAEHAKRVRRALMRSLEHQSFSFPALVDKLVPVRDPGRTPLFSVMFNVDRSGDGDILLGDLKVEPRSNFGGGAKFDLNVNVTEGPGELSLYCDYDTDLFDQATVERWLAAFERMLASIAEQPTATLGELDAVPADQRELVLGAWSGSEAESSADATLHGLFEARAAAAPDAVALIDGARKVTFAEVEECANRLARLLQAEGIGAESRVGIHLDRSAEFTVAVLAALKAGAAYLPLDPSYPAERLAYMLADSGATVVVTDAAHRATVPASAATVVSVDEDAGRIAGFEATAPESVSIPDSLAYLLYTSGSTGTPKPIGGTHGATANRCAWMWDAFPFAADEVCCQKTATGFVDSVWETFGPLLAGIPSVVLSHAAARDPNRLAQAVEANGVTRLVLVPSLLRALLADAGIVKRLRGLRLVVSSGERLPADLAESFIAALPSTRLLNLYGSTEVAADVTWHQVKAEDRPIVPIGRPISDARVYVLDERMRPVPQGVAGRLYAGGAALARGYVGRPATTAERFVPDPFSATPGARLFDTGDLARHRADGSLEYLGRRDAQVKVRGSRVEPGEVEAVLRAWPAVEDAVVDARPNAAGDTELVAWLQPRPGAVPADGLEAETERLNAFLASKLPAHLVPDRLVLVPALPRLPSGKADRRALPHPLAQAPAAPPFEEPAEGTERDLAELWREVLNVSRAGRHDRFAALGGNSLAAVRLASRIRARFGVELPVPELFRAGTLAAMAQAIEGLLLTAVSDGELAELLGELAAEAT